MHAKELHYSHDFFNGNHLEQESITHINKAHHACCELLVSTSHKSKDVGSCNNMHQNICIMELLTQKYAWAFICIYDQACSLHLCMHVYIICTSNTANTTESVNYIASILTETEHPEISQHT